MAHVIVEVTGVSSVCIGDTICSYGRKYGIDVDDNTVETLKRFQDNGFIKLTLDGKVIPVEPTISQIDPIPEPVAQVAVIPTSESQPIEKTDDMVKDTITEDEPPVAPTIAATVIAANTAQTVPEVKTSKKKRTASAQ